MIKLKNISKVFADNTIGLSDINLEFKTTGLVYLKGNVGSGKTTLLRIISGIINPTSGSINDSKFLNEHVDYISREHSLISFLNIEENIKFFSGKEVNNDLLNYLKLSKDIITKKTSDLSGGETRKIEIIQRLNTPKEILIIDEPTYCLDSENSELIIKLLKEISKEKLVIICDHNEKMLTKFCDRIIEISNGKIVLDKIINSNNDLLLKKAKKTTNNKLYIIKFLASEKKKILMYSIIFTILFLLVFIFAAIKNDKESINSKILISNNVNKTYIFGDNYSNELLNNKEFIIARTYNNYYLTKSIDSKMLYYEAQEYELNFAEIKDNEEFHKLDIIGEMPTNENELLISEYFADYNGISLNQVLVLNEQNYIITGIIKQDLKEYEILKTKSVINTDYQNYIYTKFHNGISTKDVIYVTKDFINKNKTLEENITFISYYTSNLKKMEEIIKKYNNTSYYTEDIYSEHLNNLNRIINIVRNFSIIALFIFILVIIGIFFDFINNLINQHKRNILILFQNNFKRLEIFNLKILPIIIPFIISLLISYILSNIIILLTNMYINGYLKIDFNLIYNSNLFLFSIFIFILVLILLKLYTKLYKIYKQYIYEIN